MKPQEPLPCLSANVSWLQPPDSDLNKWLRKCMDGWIDPHDFQSVRLLFPLDLFICTQHKCEEVVNAVCEGHFNVQPNLRRGFC